MITKFFFGRLLKNLLYYITTSQVAFQSINIAAGGSLSLATPWVAWVFSTLAVTSTIEDAFDKYIKQVDSMENSLQIDSL